MDLEFMALSWLRFEKRCPVALFERNPRFGLGNPDVLGITKHRYLLEIEIKRSMEDFRANSKKPFIAYRGANGNIGRYPKQFWYLVHPDLVERCRQELPEWAGLLRGPRTNGEPQTVYSVVKAPVNQQSLRLTLKESVNLAHCMSNQIYCQANSLRREREWANNDYWQARTIDYMI